MLILVPRYPGIVAARTKKSEDAVQVAHSRSVYSYRNEAFDVTMALNERTISNSEATSVEVTGPRYFQRVPQP